MYELEDTEKGSKMLSSEHDSHCNRNHTAASVTCSEPAQDWTSYQSIMDAGRPINLYSIFLGGGRSVLLYYQVLMDPGKGAIIIFSCVPIDEPRFNRWFKTHGCTESAGKVRAPGLNMRNGLVGRRIGWQQWEKR